MAFREKMRKELKAIGLTTLYFLIWFGMLMLLKWLIVAEYQIQIHGLSMVFIAAVVVAKVVLVLEHVPLGPWVRRKPAIYDVLLRTTLYAIGVFVVLLLERALEARHEHGGFRETLDWLIRNRDIHRLSATTIAVTAGLLGFNVLTVLKQRLGEGALAHMFFRAPVGAPDTKG